MLKSTRVRDSCKWPWPREYVYTEEKNKTPLQQDSEAGSTDSSLRGSHYGTKNSNIDVPA